MLDKLLVKSTAVFKKPFLIIVICTVITVILGYGITKIKIDNDIKTFLPANNADKAVYEYYDDFDRFGNNDVMVIGVQSTAFPKDITENEFKSNIIDRIAKDGDKKFVNKFYRNNNGIFKFTGKISERNKVRLISIYEGLGYKGSIYSVPVLQYVYNLRDKIEKSTKSIQLDYFVKVFNVGENDAQNIISALSQAAIKKDNAKKELKELLGNKDRLVNEFFLDPDLAEKISKTSFFKIDFEEMYEFISYPIKKIDDITNVDYMENVKIDGEDTLKVKEIIPDIENNGITEENIKVLPQRVASWTLYQNGIVSNDETVTSMLIQMRSDHISVKTKVINEIKNILKENKNENIETYLDGEPVISKSIGDYIVLDVKILMPLVMIVILLILFFCFRSFEGVAYPAFVMLLSIIWAVGFMALCGVSMNIVSTVMPVLLVAISSAYAIHQMNHYFLDPSHDKMDILKRNTGVVGLGVLMSGLAVMIGFGALAAEKFVPIRNFGIFTAIGDLFAVLIALYFLPSVLVINKRPKKGFLNENRKDFVGKLLDLLISINKKYSRQVIVLSIILAVVFAIGSVYMKSELNSILFFKKGATIRVADDFLNEKLAGTQILNVVLDTDLSSILDRNKESYSSSENIQITTPEVLNEIDKFSDDIKKEFPYIQKVISLSDYMKKINQEINGSGNPDFYKIPETKELISQYLLIFSGDLSSFLTSNHDKIRISMNMKRTDTSEIKRIKDYCDKYFTKEFKEKNHLQVNVEGGSLLYWVANNLLVEGQILSIILCMAIVFILLLIVFRNLIISFIALIPNLITILINFGTLGFFGIPLNVGTAMVTSIAIGIGVDYAIHFITWYKHEIEKHHDIEIAITETIKNKGRAIIYNMLVILGGFLVLVSSKFVPLIQFGSLVALCMLTTAFGALIVIPAIMKVSTKGKYKFLRMGTEIK